MLRNKRARLRAVALLCLAGVVALDVWTKAIALERWSTPVELFWRVRLVSTVNHGAAFSTLQGAGRWLLIAAVVVVAALFIVLFRTSRYSVAVPLSLLIGGAIGNAAGRAMRADHGVVDFIDPHLWPVFNVADAAITIGCVWLGLNLLFQSRSSE